MIPFTCENLRFSSQVVYWVPVTNGGQSVLISELLDVDHAYQQCHIHYYMNGRLLNLIVQTVCRKPVKIGYNE